MADPNPPLYESLTPQHGVRVVRAVSVEECCMAIGDVVGHANIVSASKMNRVIEVYLNDTEKVKVLTQKGIIMNTEPVPVFPFSSPYKKVMLFNVPPFLSDEAIGRELSRYGRVVSPIKKVPLGFTCPEFKHLVSFRRTVSMVLNEGVEINAVFKFSVDGFDYNIFVTSDTDKKCFNCGGTGHLAKACPKEQMDPWGLEQLGQDLDDWSEFVPPVAASEPEESQPQDQPAAQKPKKKKKKKKLKPTGATPGPEKPCMANPGAKEPRSTQPNRKNLHPPEKNSVGSGAVLEIPALAEAGTAVQSNRPETPDTKPVQEDGGGVEMVEELVFKVPGKKKKKKKGKGPAT